MLTIPCDAITRFAMENPLTGKVYEAGIVVRLVDINIERPETSVLVRFPGEWRCPWLAINQFTTM